MLMKKIMVRKRAWKHITMESEKDINANRVVEIKVPPIAEQKNESLERESKGLGGIFLYSGIFLSLDVWRQIVSYGLRYYNHGSYALPQTVVVAMAEVMKLLMCAGWLLYKRELSKVKISLLYAVPAIIYAFNSNVYYIGLRYTTPPIWNIFNQQRILLVAFIYRVRFRQVIPLHRWVALTVIIVGIIIIGKNRSSGVQEGHNMLMAFIWATIGSVISAVGSIVVEYLMKNDQRSFVEMQLQFYLFGMVAALGLTGLEAYHSPLNLADTVSKWDRPYLLTTLVILCVLLSSTAGVATGAIVKKLDNIVKLYTQALSNVITSFACAYFFSDVFKFDLIFVISLFLIFCGITLYEKKAIVDKKAFTEPMKRLCLLSV